MYILNKIKHFFLSEKDKDIVKHMNKYYLDIFIAECENDISNLKESLDEHEKRHEEFVDSDIAEIDDIEKGIELKYGYINEIEELRDILSLIKKIKEVFSDDEHTLEQATSYIEKYKKTYFKITPSTPLNQTDFNYFQKDKTNDDYMKLQEIKATLDNFLNRERG